MKKIGATLLIIASMVVFLRTLSGAAFSSPVDSSFAPPKASAFLATSTLRDTYVNEDKASLTPLQLEIPSIGVSAKVQEVGLTSQGNIGIPSNFTDVAWYKYGPAPGEKGSAIINGHLDNGLGLSGVFKNLKSVKPGDEILVKDSAGGTLRFVVEKTDAYQFKNIPEDIYSASGDSKLLLITCEGSWNSASWTYDERLVVTAVLVK